MNDLLSVVRHSRLSPGEAVLRQGASDDDLFLVLSGKLQVRIGLPAGGSVTVDEVGPGGGVGEMALLTGNARGATVTALTRHANSHTATSSASRRHPVLSTIPAPHRAANAPLADDQALIALFGELTPRLSPTPRRSSNGRRLRRRDSFREGDHGHDHHRVNGRLRACVAGRRKTRVLEEGAWRVRSAAASHQELRAATSSPCAIAIAQLTRSSFLRAQTGTCV
jgi:hypothetical protein